MEIHKSRSVPLKAMHLHYIVAVELVDSKGKRKRASPNRRAFSDHIGGALLGLCSTYGMEDPLWACLDERNPHPTYQRSDAHAYFERTFPWGHPAQGAILAYDRALRDAVRPSLAALGMKATDRVQSELQQLAAEGAPVTSESVGQLSQHIERFWFSRWMRKHGEPYHIHSVIRCTEPQVAALEKAVDLCIAQAPLLGTGSEDAIIYRGAHPIEAPQHHR